MLVMWLVGQAALPVTARRSARKLTVRQERHSAIVGTGRSVNSTTPFRAKRMLERVSPEHAA